MNTKSILVEGVECAGKTTLINALRSKLRWDCKYLGHKEDHQFERYQKEYVMAHTVILNRGHLSELVYSQLYDRPLPFAPHELTVLNEYVERNFILVHCDCDLETLQRRYAERQYSQQADIHQLATIQRKFATLLEHMQHIPYISVDSSSLSAAVQTIVHAIEP